MPKGVLWRQADIHRTAMGGRNPLTRQPWATLDELGEFAATNPVPHVVLAASPYMHGAGHWTAFLALNQGATVVIQKNVERLDPVDICSTIDREGVTYLQIVGEAFARPIVEEMEARFVRSVVTSHHSLRRNCAVGENKKAPSRQTHWSHSSRERRIV